MENNEIFARLKPFLGRRFKGSERDFLAAEFGVSPATISRMKRRLDRNPFASALDKKKPGPKIGSSRLDPRVVQVMDEVIENYYLTKRRPRKRKAYNILVERLDEKNLHIPDETTFTKRIEKLPKSKIQNGRLYYSERMKLHSPKTQHVKTYRPMEIVQVDHSSCNAFIIDSLDGEELGRANLTVFKDIYTRMCIAFVISLYKPNSETVGTGLALGCFDKTKYLEEVGLQGIWHSLGLPEALHMDNAAEFKSGALIDACGEYGIKRIYRRVKTPHDGAHIESLIDTINESLRDIPGATYRNIKEKGDSPAQKLAVYTLPLLEKHIVNFIINNYHIREHSGLFGMSPLQKYQEACENGSKPRLVPKSRNLFAVDFCKSFNRLVRPIGVEFECKEYWNSALGQLYNNNVKSVKVLPYNHSIKAIRIVAPGGEIFSVPAKDKDLPDMTRQEWKRYSEVVKSKHRANGMTKSQLADFIRIERSIELEAKGNAKHI